VASITLGYAILVGLAPSVVRSAVMTLAFCAAAVVRRPTQSANTLALAGVLTLAWNPFFLLDVGCQLSFLAIGALIWLVPAAERGLQHALTSLRSIRGGAAAPLEKLKARYRPWWQRSLRRLLNWVGTGVLSSVVVWLAALPLVALWFHLVSPIAVLLNIPLIPFTSIALLLGTAGMGLSLLDDHLALLPLQGCAFFLRVTEWIVRWAAAQTSGHRFVCGPSWITVAVFYSLLLLATVLSSWGLAKSVGQPSTLRQGALWCAVALSLIPGWVVGWPARASRPMQGQILAVGHGLAIVLQLPGGQSILYDCGRMGDPRVGRRIIAPALWSLGVTRLDAIYLSHADQDHFNALPDLMDRFSIGHVVIPAGFENERASLAPSLMQQVRALGIPVHTIAAPAAWEQAGARFAVLHPPAQWHPESSDNARSLVLDVEYRGHHLLLTGDLDQPGLNELMSRPQPGPSIDLLCAPHHGGRSANPPSLYSWAQPHTVVVSQRMPAPGTGDILALLDQRGIPLLRTWQRGAIHFQWQSGGIVTIGFIDRTDRL
jgi:competence protein ComEC